MAPRTQGVIPCLYAHHRHGLLAWFVTCAGVEHHSHAPPNSHSEAKQGCDIELPNSQNRDHNQPEGTAHATQTWTNSLHSLDPVRLPQVTPAPEFALKSPCSAPCLISVCLACTGSTPAAVLQARWATRQVHRGDLHSDRSPVEPHQGAPHTQTLCQPQSSSRKPVQARTPSRLRPRIWPQSRPTGPP